MDYEQKYKEALEKARQLCAYPTTKSFISDLQDLFPELAESEDERIRKVIIEHFAGLPSSIPYKGFTKEQILAWLEKQDKQNTNILWHDVSEEPEERREIFCEWSAHDDVCQGAVLHDVVFYHTDTKIFWDGEQQIERVVRWAYVDEMLEKQGEQKYTPKHKLGDTIYYNSFGEVKSMIVANVVTDSTDNPMYEDENGSAVFEKDLIEQKPVDKVEPKFQVGDWVVFNNHHQSIYQVEKIEDGYYILRHTHGGTFRVCVLHDESLRLWNFNDAKGGDILYSPSHRLIWIYKDSGQYYACANMNYTTECINTNGLISIPNDVCPAKKDEQTILFKSMEEAGYAWDADKKELIKL